MKKITLTVPSSSGNIGCGFDTLGIAVNLHNRFEIQLSPSETTLEILGGIDPALHSLCFGMVQEAAQAFFSHSGATPCPFSLRVESHIPIARGLASSATFRLAILEGLNQLLDLNIGDMEIVQWAAELEGCTDNVAACYYGGLCASGIINDRLVYYAWDLPDQLDFVAVSPTLEVETDKARKIFSPTLPRQDAIFNLNRGILLVSAFAQNDYHAIGDLLDDRLHQPQRQAGIPALRPLFEVIHAARQAGSIGAYLSGSGSTMMALTVKNKEAVAQAMQDVITQHGMQSEVRFLKVDNEGTRWDSE